MKKLFLLVAFIALTIFMPEIVSAEETTKGVTPGSGQYDFYDYFIDVSWDKRYYDELGREEWYLKIVPSKKMRYSIFTENKEYSWSLIYSKFYNDYRWKNSQSLKEQYFCHISKAFFKSSWNLEPFRISSNIVCN